METTTGIDKPSTNRSKARVTRACDACKGRKIRCTGAQPCAHCIKYKKVCEYKAEHGRGNPPPPKKASEEEQQAYLAGYGWPVASKNDTSSPSNAEPVEQIVGNEGQMNFAPENDDYRPFEDTPDRIHRDIPLHRRGQSTESAVYESSQNNMNHRLAHHQKSSIFAYGDPPVPEIVTSFMALPSVTRAYELVDQFFEFTSGIHRVLHRQTTLTWTKNLLNSPGSYHNDADENSQRAVVLVVFATVHTFLSHETKDATADLSLQYFLAAEQQLKDETGSVKITTIQARLLQILYLLSRSRIHQAYSIFCTVIGLTFTLGIHRGYNPISEDDPLQIDCQRRVFWGIYLVDKYLSSALGRPQLLRDEDIDQTLPVMIDDEGLSPGIFMLTGNQGIMKAAIFHIKLTQIIARILSSLYTISKPPPETRYSLARSLALQLDAWRNGDIKPFLDLSPDTLDPLFQRQHLALHLAYGQAQIILYRPFLLEDRRESTEGERLVKNCLDASMNIIGIIDSMYEVQETFATSWFAHFCAYNAVVALYVYVIKATSSRSLTQPWKLYFEVASRCQDQIKTSSETESFAQKCSVVLEELRFEALGHIRNDGGQDGTPNGGIDGIGSGIPEAGGRTNSSSYFGGRWNDMTFDQGAPGGGILGSLFGNVDGIHVRSGTGSVVERIDQWGFSSLTGY